MLFLCALHSRYVAIVDQFRSRSKDIETSTIDAIVSDASFHDGFIEVNHKKSKPTYSPGPCVPAAASATTNSDRQGKVWQTPFEWLAQYGKKGIKGRWTQALAGTGICPICHKAENPRHVPLQCPLLASLNLKLVTCPPAGKSNPAPSSAPASNPGGLSASTDATPPPPLSGSAVPPSGLSAAVTLAPPADGDYDSGDDFHLEGDEYGAEFTPPKVNTSVSRYTPSCSHVSIISPSSALPPSPSTRHPPWLSSALQHLLNSLSLSPVVLPTTTGHLTVADTGDTDHMVPDKSAFVSYKSISGLSVRMGNNSYVPVLGLGTVAFALNGKRVLIRNVLHVPSLAVPLYSLRMHVTQRGCGFIGTEDSGFLAYFPMFVLSVDTAVDTHLSFDYVQPRCPPALYPSEVAPALSTAAPSPASRVVIEDDDVSASPALAPVDSPTSPSVIDMQHLSSTIQSLTDDGCSSAIQVFFASRTIAHIAIGRGPPRRSSFAGGR